MSARAQAVWRGLKDVHAERAAADPFEERKGDVAAVEHGEREEVEEREVDVDEDGEPERELPAVGAAEDVEEDLS